MSKTRLEAFSDGMFAIILTVLVLELKVPHLENTTWPVFLGAMTVLVPKLLSFVFSFFIIAIFWVNHHHFVHLVDKVDTKLLWLNISLLFFACLFPFLTAFIGDYPPVRCRVISFEHGLFRHHAGSNVEIYFCRQ